MSTSADLHSPTRRQMLDSFSERAPKWDSDPRRQALIRDVLSGLRRSTPINKAWRVLDYGCGTGSLAIQLLPLVGEVTAADASTGMIAEATRRKLALSNRSASSRLTTLRLDLVEDPPLSIKFDLIVACCVLHHVADLDSVCRAFAHMTAPGAWVAVVGWAQPNPPSATSHYPIYHRTTEVYATALKRHLNPAQIKCQIVHHFPQDDGTLRPAFLLSAGPIAQP